MASVQDIVAQLVAQPQTPVPIMGDLVAPDDWREREAAGNLAAQPAPSRSWGDTLGGLIGLPSRVVGGAVEAVRHPVDTTSNVLGSIAAIPQRAIEGSMADMATIGSGGPKQSIAPAVDATMLLAGVGAPMAESGAAGIFGGKLSKVADHGAIAKAEQMEAAGAAPDAIWNDAKTARGADQQWRQEINDSGAKLKLSPSDLKSPEIDPNHISRSGDFTKSTYLDDVLHHPDLYDAYPHLKDVEVVPLPADLAKSGTRGDYSHYGDTNIIRLNKNLDADQARSTLLHEVQHAVQNTEGFAPGDNPANHIPAALAPARQQFETVRANTQSEIAKNLNTNIIGVEYMKDMIRREKYGPDAAQQAIPEPFVNVFQGILSKNPDVRQRLGNLVDSEKMLSDADQAAHAKYQAAMGEVESRNVQKRLGGMGEVAPMRTEDTPRILQRDPRGP